MIGEKFHHLLVLENLGLKIKNNRNRTYYKCQCKCGNTIEISSDRLGLTKSCGCLKHEKKFKIRDLKGQKFGKLLVLNESGFLRVGKAKQRRKLWSCKCDCGKHLDVIEASLISKNTESCGCLFKETISKNLFNDIEGKKFGRWFVLNWVEKKGNHHFWKCECDCGNVRIVQAANLISETSKSCGCYFKERVTKHGLSNSKNYHSHLRSDPVRKLKHRVSCEIRKQFKNKNIKKNGSIFDYLPYSFEELKDNLESKFESWMSWDNYGGNLNDPELTWHIDHIIPQNSFIFTSMNDVEFQNCWALSNLRPLEKHENRIKGSKIN